MNEGLDFEEKYFNNRVLEFVNHFFANVNIPRITSYKNEPKDLSKNELTTILREALDDVFWMKGGKQVTRDFESICNDGINRFFTVLKDQHKLHLDQTSMQNLEIFCKHIRTSLSDHLRTQKEEHIRAIHSPKNDSDKPVNDVGGKVLKFIKKPR